MKNTQYPSVDLPKLQLIDYGYDNCFGLINPNSTSYDLDIDGVVFTFGAGNYYKPNEVTLNGLFPSKILIKRTIPSTIVAYTDGADQITPEEHYNTRTKFDIREDDGVGNLIWSTREDRDIYEDFITRWEPVYSDPINEWVPIELDIVKKQYIPDRYRDYIYSSIIIGKSNTYISICTYKLDYKLMMRAIAEQLGFTIVEYKLFNDGVTIGKQVTISDTSSEFSRCNNVYFGKENERKLTNRAQCGTLQECITEFERHWDVIYQWMNIQRNILDIPGVDDVSKKQLYDLIQKSKTVYHRIDPFKNSRSDYNQLGKLLTELENSLIS